NDAAETNLWSPAGAFTGRGQELAALAEMIDRGERLVTLTGVAGIGKTRLALEYAAAHRRAHAHDGGTSAWFFDLTECRDLDGICGAIGRAWGVRLVHGDAAEQIGHALAGRGRALVVLDNCEQAIEAASGLVARWLALAPRTQFLVTSRETM